MKRLLILGAGTAGTMMANRCTKKNARKRMANHDCRPGTDYYYQQFLFLPFGIYSAADVTRPKRQFLPNAAESIEAEIDRVDPEQNRVLLGTGDSLGYDLLIIATGAKTAPDQTEGMTGTDGASACSISHVRRGCCVTPSIKRWEDGSGLQRSPR